MTKHDNRKEQGKRDAEERVMLSEAFKAEEILVMTGFFEVEKQKP